MCVSAFARAWDSRSVLPFMADSWKLTVGLSSRLKDVSASTGITGSSEESALLTIFQWPSVHAQYFSVSSNDANSQKTSPISIGRTLRSTSDGLAGFPSVVSSSPTLRLQFLLEHVIACDCATRGSPRRLADHCKP